MHEIVVKTKDGQTFHGLLTTVRLDYQEFVLTVGSMAMVFSFDACESVIMKNERISVNEIGDDDCLSRWHRQVREASQPTSLDHTPTSTPSSANSSDD